MGLSLSLSILLSLSPSPTLHLSLSLSPSLAFSVSASLHVTLQPLWRPIETLYILQRISLQIISLMPIRVPLLLTGGPKRESERCSCVPCLRCVLSLLEGFRTSLCEKSNKSIL